MGYIDWIDANKNARIFGMGDWLNVATRTSKTNPLMATMTLKEAAQFIHKLFWPVRKKIVGIIDGNHEQRLIDAAGYSPLNHTADMLGVPHLGNASAVRFIIGADKIKYIGFFHHMTGGGGTPGGKVNRVAKLTEMYPDADFYCGAHTHILSAVRSTVMDYGANGKEMMRRRLFVNTGGFLEYRGSYAEAKMLAPVEIGSPRIRMDGKTKDLHVAI
jgi:hypothetical protein